MLIRLYCWLITLLIFVMLICCFVVLSGAKSSVGILESNRRFVYFFFQLCQYLCPAFCGPVA